MKATVGLIASGLWQRRWLSMLVFAVAVAAAAAAAMGPPYAHATSTAILRNAFTGAGPSAQGLMVTYPPSERPRLDHPGLRDATGIPDAFSPPVESAELPSSLLEDPANAVKLIWREGVCAQLTIVEGSCPSEKFDVVASEVTAARYDWKIGDEILLEVLHAPGIAGTGAEEARPRSAPAIILTGIYAPLNPDGGYWLGLPYFPDTTGTADSEITGRLFDPLFTPRSTATATRRRPLGWQPNVTLFVDVDRLDGRHAKAVDAAVATIRDRVTAAEREPGEQPPLVYSGMQTVTGRTVRALDALGIPIALVVLQLLTLSWVVLHFALTDLLHARRSEFGLARLRGLNRGQVWRIAVAEPAVLLIAALPVGVAVGWATAKAISEPVLPPGIPVPIGWIAWLSATAAIAGGLLAAGLAARTTATASVTELLRGSRAQRRRTWVPEAVAVALAGVGIFELTTGALIQPARGQAASLLVPGLVSIGGALITSRLLPLVAGPAIRRERRVRLARFLALRQIARAPQTWHAVVVLAASFGLATFALSAWSVTSQNHRTVAEAHNGAPAILIVRPPLGSSLPQLLAEADPGGRSAAAVAVFDSSTRTLAVDSSRIGSVAHWESDYADEPFAELLEQLRPEVAQSVHVSGEGIRLTVDSSRVRAREFSLYATLELPGSSRRVDVPLRPSGRSGGDVHDGRLSLTCRSGCELRGITVRSDTGAAVVPNNARLDVRSIEVRSSGTWRTVDAGLDDTSRWRGETPAGELRARVEGTARGLTLRFLTGVETMAVVATHPEELPAITVGRVAPDPGGADAIGLDGEELPVRSIARVKGLPGATGPSAMIDIGLAQDVAYGTTPTIEHQVWVDRGAASRVERGLRAQGVTVASVRTVDQLVGAFERQGPGLAIRLLLASSGAAVVLALARAIYGLYTTRRRRQYEFAALTVLGVRSRTQKGALLLEQAITLGVGALAGVAAGTAAAGVALPRIPQFAVEPITPPISYTPDAAVVGVFVVAALVVVALAVVIVTEVLFRSLRLEQLREAPP